MKRSVTLTILLLAAITAAGLAGCQPGATPAKFDVTSLTVNPADINIGETATVSAIVSNVGGSNGIYNAVLLIDTVRSDAKSVELAPGMQQKVTFQISLDTAGKYAVEIGNADATINVRTKFVAKPTELKYDGSCPVDYLGLDKPATGYLVSFVPPSTQFVINNIRIMGLVYGTRGAQTKNLEIQILDKNKKVVFSDVLSGNKFPQISNNLSLDLEKKGDWEDLFVPAVKVEGNFYVHIYTGVTTGQGFRMGVDNSVINMHSDITMRDANGVDNPMPTWPYPVSKCFGDRNRVNWMVHVNGDAMVPAK
jgi:hypothetical protein